MREDIFNAFQLLSRKLDRVLSKLGELDSDLEQLDQQADLSAIKETITMAWIDDMRTQVAATKTVGESAVAAINLLADQLQEVINNGGDPAELQAFVDTLRDSDAAVAAAIQARTVAASEPAPVTQEEVGVEPTSE